MKICDTCQRQYADSLQYCLEDGTVLRVLGAPPATLRIEGRSTHTNVRTERRLLWGLFAFVAISLAGLVVVVAGWIILSRGFGKDSKDLNGSSDPPARTTSAGQPGSNPGTTKADVEGELDQINSDVGMAFVQSDVARLDRLLADDYRYVGDAGLTLTKPEIMTLYNTGNLSYEYLTPSDPKIEVSSDLTKGVVTGHAKSKGYLKRVPFTDSYFYRNSYEKRQGRWQLVSGISWH
jgi:hypothetical protein